MSQNLTQRYHIFDESLALRRAFVGIQAEDVKLLKQLQPWANRVADRMAKEFYDYQFAFSETRAFFDDYASKKGMTLDKLRARLEMKQAGYFREIFQEALQEGGYGEAYFEKRLRVGQIHNIINLPLKWYVGSYTLYQQLTRKFLAKDYWFRPGFRLKAEHAIFSVFNFDMQAVADAFFYDYLQSIGLNLDLIDVRRRDQDLSEHYTVLKDSVARPLSIAIEAGAHLARASRELSGASGQAASATTVVASRITGVVSTLQDESTALSTTSESMRHMQQAIEGVAKGAAEQARAVTETAAVATASVDPKILATLDAYFAAMKAEKWDDILPLVNASSPQTKDNVKSALGLMAAFSKLEAAAKSKFGSGFSAIAATLSTLALAIAREVIALLNRFFDATGGAVEAAGGES